MADKVFIVFETVAYNVRVGDQIRESYDSWHDRWQTVERISQDRGGVLCFETEFAAEDGWDPEDGLAVRRPVSLKTLLRDSDQVRTAIATSHEPYLAVYGGSDD